LVDKLKQAGGYQVEGFTLRRYQNGKVLVEKPLRARMMAEYGAEWMYVWLSDFELCSRLTRSRAIHRGDYQKVLLSEALDMGADVTTSAEVISIESTTDAQQRIMLRDGRRIEADVVVGADGTHGEKAQAVLYP
jgi:salicylate hydroxylase